jgi:hypothetical protein
VKEDWREGLSTMSSQQSFLLDSGAHSDCTFLVGTDGDDTKEVNNNIPIVCSNHFVIHLSL